MFWPFSIYRVTHSTQRHIWAQVLILRETEKAVLVDIGTRIWIPKSQIHRIRLRDNIFEIYVKESTLG